MRLIADARDGRSGVLVVRGEAGIGKTALLDNAVARATGMRVAHLSGAESEMELSYAALHQLCAPLLNRVARLPGPQADALRVAFGLRIGEAPDRFLVGLATLTLIGEAAAERPIICVVDDAQWVDQASLQVLTFVARRLFADPVVMIFAVREPAFDHTLAGLPELRLGRLDDRDARALLTSIMPSRLEEHLRDQIIAEADGNPLALTELYPVLSSAELAGGLGIAQTTTVVKRIETAYGRRFRELPPQTRRLLLLAAAEPTGEPTWLWAAAARLDLSIDAATPAEDAGLLTIGARVKFRHPLVRSVIYRDAPLTERRVAHAALAEVIEGPDDTELRAWHRAHAATSPDAATASELEQAALRARSRGGVTAAAALFTHAAALTPSSTCRAERMLAAAEANLDAGDPESALTLLTQARVFAGDELTRARIDLVRAKVAMATNRGSDAPPLLLAAAERLADLDQALARETYFEALAAAIFAGRLVGTEGKGVAEVARAACNAPAPPNPPRAVDLLLDGLVARFTLGYTAAAPLLINALRELRREDTQGTGDVRVYQVGGRVALDLYDHES